MDNLQLELQRLQVENARLWEERPEETAELDAAVEAEHLKLEAERRCDRAELERYRALEAERQKWEAREERLLEQL